MREEEFRLEEGLEEGGVYSRDNTSPHDATFPAGSRVCRSLTRYEPPRSGSCASSVACAPLANPCVIFADSAPPLRPLTRIVFDAKSTTSHSHGKLLQYADSRMYRVPSTCHLIPSQRCPRGAAPSARTRLGCKGTRAAKLLRPSRPYSRWRRSTVSTSTTLRCTG